MAETKTKKEKAPKKDAAKGEKKPALPPRKVRKPPVPYGPHGGIQLLLTDDVEHLGKMGDVVEVNEKSHKVQSISDSLDAVVRRGVPQWLELDKDNMKGVIKAFPVRDDLTMPIQEQLIVELYSK